MAPILGGVHRAGRRVSVPAGLGLLDRAGLTPFGPVITPGRSGTNCTFDWKGALAQVRPMRTAVSHAHWRHVS